MGARQLRPDAGATPAVAPRDTRGDGARRLLAHGLLEGCHREGRHGGHLRGGRWRLASSADRRGEVALRRLGGFYRLPVQVWHPPGPFPQASEAIHRPWYLVHRDGQGAHVHDGVPGHRAEKGVLSRLCSLLPRAKHQDDEPASSQSLILWIRRRIHMCWVLAMRAAQPTSCQSVTLDRLASTG